MTLAKPPAKRRAARRTKATPVFVCQCAWNLDKADEVGVRCRCLGVVLMNKGICLDCKVGQHVGIGGVRGG